MKTSRLQFLTELLSQPTAPFREEHVLALVERALLRARVPAFLDPAGNLVIGVDSPAAYRSLLRQRSSEPVRLFVAHMDHPGFHGLRWLAPGRLAVKWHGGSPANGLAGAHVWLADATGYVAEGTLARARLLPSRHALDTAEVRLRRRLPEPQPAASLYGGFRFRAPVWRRNDRIYTKAADDLVGVFAIVSLAQELFDKTSRKRPPFLGLLTRGEEVGFVGAIAHLEFGWFEARRRPLVAISIETSRALPNAVIGKGPVVRLGDRRTVFDPDALRVLSDIAERILPGRHQRRVMDGGTCEATAAISWGLPAIGISVPLGNYHNERFGAVTSSAGDHVRERGGPAPEHVHLNDIDGLIKLCRGLLEPGLPWADPWHRQRTRLRRQLRQYKNML